MCYFLCSPCSSFTLPCSSRVTLRSSCPLCLVLSVSSMILHIPCSLCYFVFFARSICVIPCSYYSVLLELFPAIMGRIMSTCDLKIARQSRLVNSFVSPSSWKTLPLPTYLRYERNVNDLLLQSRLYDDNYLTLHI